MQENLIPEPLPIDPAEEIKILKIEVEPYPDKRRVKVKFNLSSFTQGPSALITLISNEVPLTSVNIVNIFVPENEITLHIPGSGVIPGDYQVKLDLFFIIEATDENGADTQIQLQQSHLDNKTVSFNIQ